MQKKVQFREWAQAVSSKPSDGVEMEPVMHCITFLRQDGMGICHGNDEQWQHIIGTISHALYALSNTPKQTFKVNENIPLLHEETETQKNEITLPNLHN